MGVLELSANKSRSLSSASTCVSSGSESEPLSPSMQSVTSPWGSECDGSEFGCITEQIPALSVDDPTKTTVIAKNVPARYTKSMVLELLDSFGFKGKYDFVYLPVDFSTRCSFGYAFVNFVS